MEQATLQGPSVPGHGGVTAGLDVLIVDDHEMIRVALRLLLETCLGLQVTDVSSAEEALDAVSSRPFDVVLMDVKMPVHDGLWTLEEIHRIRPTLPVIMLSYFADERSVRHALDAGAAGYLVKDAELHQVVDSLTTALEGDGVYLHPVAAKCVLANRHAEGGVAELTEREHEVLTLLVEGATNDEIATRLFITEKTVKTHLSGVFRKLGVANRTQAATRALREGLV
jgi:DNA-binding NarL/FixJ family response regulator